MPTGLRLSIDEAVRRYDSGRTWLQVRSGRLLRLKPEAAAAIEAISAGREAGEAARRLARRLLAAGMAHPVPDRCEFLDAITVVIPVLDRSAALDRCLGALLAPAAFRESAGPVRARRLEVVVVDDGSHDLRAVEAVCARHAVTCLPRAKNGGPAAARNTGLAHVHTEFVAFLDSDCVTDPEWLHRLAGHLRDPLVAAVAPRVVAAPVDGRRPSVRSPLDLGPRPAAVAPGTHVSYVPTAALIVRMAALAGLTGSQEPVAPFDEQLRFGEDVDLVWRLVDAGWTVRYDPSVEVEHTEPDDIWAGLARRFRYGTSAGPLARRYPDRLAPMRLSRASAAGLALMLVRRPALGAAVLVGSAVRLERSLRRFGLPRSAVLQLTTRSFAAAALGAARAANTYLPGVFPLLAVTRRRPVMALASTAPLIADWAEQPRGTNPWRWALGTSAAQVAYGLGVWTAAVRSRSLRPVRPRLG